MTDAGVWSLVLSTLALIIGIASFLRNSKTDTAVDASWKGSVDATLKNKVDKEALAQWMGSINEKVANKVDAATHNALMGVVNEKLDRISDELGKLGEIPKIINDVADRLLRVEVGIEIEDKRMDDHLRTEHKIEP